MIPEKKGFGGSVSKLQIWFWDTNHLVHGQQDNNMIIQIQLWLFYLQAAWSRKQFNIAPYLYHTSY